MRPVQRGDLVAVPSDYDLEKRIWSYGPQFKIALTSTDK